MWYRCNSIPVNTVYSVSFALEVGLCFMLQTTVNNAWPKSIIQLLWRPCSYHVHQRSRVVEVLLSEQRETLFLHEWHEWFSVEMEWSERVLYEKEFNAADHHRREQWQRVSTVHNELLIRHTRPICVAWRSRSSSWQLFQMALDRRTIIRYGSFNLYNKKPSCR